MSSDDIATTVDGGNEAMSTTEAMDVSGVLFNESSIIPTSDEAGAVFTNIQGVLNITEDGLNNTDTESEYALFKIFVIIEIIMTTFELFVSILAVTQMARWRKNYRNQMLMQFTLARFIKRLLLIFQFLEHYGKIPTSFCITNTLSCFQFYIDFVIVILVFFFIKHMYNSLIIVIVKVSQNDFYRVLICAWLIPIPISAMFTILIVTDVINKWLIYLLICSILRWPLILIGTGFYIVIVYRVLADKIRQFASSLAIVTFLLCFILNIYLFSKDIIELFCFESFSTKLVSYVSGLLLNLLILSLYVILIMFSINKTQASRSELPDYSLAEAKCENVLSFEND